MEFYEEERPSDSPNIERVWRSESDHSFGFVSRAENHSEIVIVKHQGRTIVTVRGPETMPSSASVSANAQCIGIVFRLGTFMPLLLPKHLMDRRDADLPVSSTTSFRLDGSTWEVPTYENADTFVERLVRRQLLVHDPEVSAVLQDRPSTLSTRTVQYRVVRATGLAYRTIRQIERAQRATALLSQGQSILDTAIEAGYYDQSHLARSLKRFVGLTPLQIAQARWSGSVLAVDSTGPSTSR
jgi:AraC-like DNA-binding protein